MNWRNQGGVSIKREKFGLRRTGKMGYGKAFDRFCCLSSLISRAKVGPNTKRNCTDLWVNIRRYCRTIPP